MNRFFLPPEILARAVIDFPDEQSNQINKVLRLREGDEVIGLDGANNEYRIRLNEVSKGQVSGEVLEQTRCLAEPVVQLHLFISFTQREKFELILQKCTEIGVSDFTPVFFARSLVQKSVEFENKQLRWNKILQEAAEQSGRGIIPQLHEPLKHGQAINATGFEVKLLAWTQEKSLHLTQEILGHEQAKNVALMIGSEGGMTADEVTAACEAGWIPVSLGKRILRMETAAMVGSALILAATDSDQPAG